MAAAAAGAGSGAAAGMAVCAKPEFSRELPNPMAQAIAAHDVSLFFILRFSCCLTDVIEEARFHTR
jgi:hypothetical protein